MTEETNPMTQADEDAALAAPPDEQNPAMIDAYKTFIYTMIGAILFIGSVIVFIL